MNKKPKHGNCPICQGREKMWIYADGERKQVDCQCVQRVRFRQTVEDIRVHLAIARANAREAKR